MVTLHATAVASNSGCTNPTNALGAPDGTWTTNHDDNVNWTCRWELDLPEDPLGGTQEVTVHVRKSAAGGNGNPSVTVVLFNGATEVRTLQSGVALTGEHQLGPYEFDASEAATPHIELRSSAQGGSPSGRRNVQVDGFTFEAEEAEPNGGGNGGGSGDRFFYDFTDGMGGFTSRIGSWSIVDDELTLVAPSGDLDRFISIDVADNESDIEIVTRCGASFGADLNNTIFFRSDPDPADNSFFAVYDGNDPIDLAIEEYVGGSYSPRVSEPTGAELATNGHILMRARISGSTIEVKAWNEEDPEPEDYEATYTGATQLTSGLHGVGAFRGSRTYYFDWIGVGLNGASAPMSEAELIETIDVEPHTVEVNHGALEFEADVAVIELGTHDIEVQHQDLTWASSAEMVLASHDAELQHQDLVWQTDDPVTHEVERERWDGSDWVDTDLIPVGEETFLQDDGLTPNTTYRWRVRKVQGTETSDWTDWVEATTLSDTVTVTIDEHTVELTHQALELEAGTVTVELDVHNIEVTHGDLELEAGAAAWDLDEHVIEIQHRALNWSSLADMTVTSHGVELVHGDLAWDAGAIERDLGSHTIEIAHGALDFTGASFITVDTHTVEVAHGDVEWIAGASSVTVDAHDVHVLHEDLAWDGDTVTVTLDAHTVEVVHQDLEVTTDVASITLDAHTVELMHDALTWVGDVVATIDAHVVQLSHGDVEFVLDVETRGSSGFTTLGTVGHFDHDELSRLFPTLEQPRFWDDTSPLPRAFADVDATPRLFEDASLVERVWTHARLTPRNYEDTLLPDRFIRLFYVHLDEEDIVIRLEPIIFAPLTTNAVPRRLWLQVHEQLRSGDVQPIDLFGDGWEGKAVIQMPGGAAGPARDLVIPDPNDLTTLEPENFDAPEDGWCYLEFSDGDFPNESPNLPAGNVETWTLEDLTDHYKIQAAFRDAGGNVLEKATAVVVPIVNDGPAADLTLATWGA